MCGWFFSSSEINNIKKDFIKSELSKRGPDDFNESNLNKFIFMHARLSITGDKVSGKQPAESTRFIMLFNGQIYNYEELATEINFEITDKTSDTEVLMKFIEISIENNSSWQNIFAKLDGFFSILLFDKSNQEVILSRDIVGKKPLYYQNNDSFSASTRATCLICGNEINLNKRSIKEYLFFGKGLIDEHHWFEDVKVLNSGEFLIYSFQNKDCRVKSYKIQKFSNSERFENLLYEAVAKRINTNKKMACATSSGVDSTTIFTQIKSMGYTVKPAIISFFPEEESELPSMLEKLKITKDECEVIEQDSNVNDIEKIFNNAIDALEIGHSSSAIIPYSILCSELNKRGYKVLIEGQGSDELLLGYDIYLLVASIQAFKKLELLNSYKFFKAYKKLFGFRNSLLELIRLVFPVLSKFQYIIWRGHKILSRDFLRIKSGYMNRYSFKNLKEFKYLQLKNLQNLLHYGDSIPLYYGIENRNPFCDLTFRKFCLDNLTINDCIYGNQGKMPLREYSKNVLNLEHKVEKKIGFFSNSVNLLKNSNEFSPKELHQFLIFKGLMNEKAKIKDLLGLPDNIYFRFCSIKSTIVNLERKGFKVNSFG